MLGIIEATISKLKGYKWYFFSVGNDSFAVRDNDNDNATYYFVRNGKPNYNATLNKIMHTVKLGENYFDILPDDIP